MISTAFGAFLHGFFALLPRFIIPFLVSWVAVLGLELLAGTRLRGHLRPHILRVDEYLRSWALSKRFRERGNPASDRHGRTWFMRFWTNFASAISLITLSLALAVGAHALKAPHPVLFYFPGLCYLGSMAQSYVSKRAIKRVRPPRDQGAFGFKMRDSSFPSGHSLTSFCFWFPFAVAVGAAGFGGGWAAFAALFALVTVGFTGLSRVYMGVHFPSDVLGGYTMGLVWTLMCVLVLLPILRGAW